MILKAIEIYNLRRFSGNHRLVFSTGSLLPVHLVWGGNGFGKTTLLRAIQTCLFPAAPAYLLRASEITKGPDWDKSPTIRVSLEFESNGKDYRLTRTWTKRPGKNETSADSMDTASSLQTLPRGDQLIVPDQIDEFIRTLMPEEISSFFLFDGEQIQRYSDPKISGAQVRQALERLLGIQVYKQLADDLRNIEKKLRDTRDHVAVGQELSIKEERSANIDSRLRSIASERQRLRAEAKRIEQELGRINADIQNASDYFSPDVQQRRQELDATRDRIEGAIYTLRASVSDILSLGLPLFPFVKELSASATAFQKRAAELEFPRTLTELAGFLFMNAQPISDVLADARSAEAVLPELSRLLWGDQGQHSTPQAARDSYWIMNEKATDLARWPQYNVELAQLDESLQQVQAELARLPEPGRYGGDIAALRSALQQNTRIKERIEGAIRAFGPEEMDLRKEQDTVARDLSRLRQEHSAYERLSRQIDLCRSLDAVLQDFIGQLTDARVDELEAAVSQRFMQLTNIPLAIEGVEIDRTNYALSIKQRRGFLIEGQAGSAGQQEILAFALIWSLTALTQKRLPIVIDTPLARLDTAHRQAMLTQCFPRLGPQVIILATDEELGPEDEQLVDPHVATKHVIQFDPETQTSRFEARSLYG